MDAKSFMKTCCSDDVVFNQIRNATKKVAKLFSSGRGKSILKQKMQKVSSLIFLDLQEIAYKRIHLNERKIKTSLTHETLKRGFPDVYHLLYF